MLLELLSEVECVDGECADGKCVDGQCADGQCADGEGEKGLRLDCAIVNTDIPSVKLVESTDFFYPLVDDPYLQGEITCANVLSDLYALGITKPTNMLQLLGVSTQLPPETAKIVTKLIMRGFNDTAKLARVKVTGGQTVRNPWFIVGGVVTSVVKELDIIRPISATPGDVLVLTKPLGTNCAVTAYHWLNDESKLAALSNYPESKICALYKLACDSMKRLNRSAAELMHRYEAHAATDVTGFGLFGHAWNLAQQQIKPVSFIFNTILAFDGAMDLDKVVESGLITGNAIETSGGLLVVLKKEKAIEFCQELTEREGWPCVIVGDVVDGDRSVRWNIESPIVVQELSREECSFNLKEKKDA